MTVRRNPGPDDDADDHIPDAPGRWQHPSEVGLAERGRTDRRRSSVIAVGLVLSGIGLLVSGVMLGSMDADDEPDDVVADRIEKSVVNIVVDDEGVSSTVTGLVLDDQGHLVVPASTLEGADEIWARCVDGKMQRSDVVARDDEQDLAVVKVASPAGRPVELSSTAPEPGVAVLAVAAVPGGITTSDATVGTSGSSTPADRFHAEPASATAQTALVFDRDGALMGMSTRPSTGSQVEVRSAAGMLSAAQRLLER